MYRFYSALYEESRLLLERSQANNTPIAGDATKRPVDAGTDRPANVVHVEPIDRGIDHRLWIMMNEALVNRTKPWINNRQGIDVNVDPNDAYKKEDLLR
jgi:hypothetical protein